MRRVFLAVFLATLMLLCSCGSPPSKVDADIDLNIKPEESVIEPTCSPVKHNIVEPELVYSRKKLSLQNVSFKTTLYDISVDASAEMVEALTLPDLVVKPRPLNDFSTMIDIPEGWSTHFSQHGYTVRFTLDNPNILFDWDTNDENRWDELDCYDGELMIDEVTSMAYEWAKICGFNEVSVVETRAYGRNRDDEIGFRSVILQTYHNGVGITPESYVTPTYSELCGERMVFMVNEEGCINVQLLALDVVDYVENKTPLISIDSALESFRNNVDMISDASQGVYVIRRVALEYVPISREENQTQILVPAWTFSSAINYRTNRNMVVWIDARTGEVIR